MCEALSILGKVYFLTINCSCICNLANLWVFQGFIQSFGRFSSWLTFKIKNTLRVARSFWINTIKQILMMEMKYSIINTFHLLINGCNKETISLKGTLTTYYVLNIIITLSSQSCFDKSKNLYTYWVLIFNYWLVRTGSVRNFDNFLKNYNIGYCSLSGVKSIHWTQNLVYSIKNCT